MILQQTLITGSPSGFLNNILSVNDEFLSDTIFHSAIKKKTWKIFFHSLDTDLQFFQYGNFNYSFNGNFNIVRIKNFAKL